MNANVEQKILRYLNSESNLFRNAARAVLKHPKGGTVHRLRVSSRKLRVVLKLLDKGISNPRIHTVLQSLKKLARVAGKERELEVAEKDAHRYDLRLKKLRAKKHSAQNEIVKVIQKASYRNLSKKIEGVVDELKAKPIGRLPDWSENTQALEVWLTRRLRKSRDFHALRIAVKKARYVLEAAGKQNNSLRALQDDLGRAHDLEVLQKMGGNRRRVKKAKMKYQRRSKQNLGKAVKSALRELNELST